MAVRLHKFIAECGIASRREAERLIGEGRVMVNRDVVKKMGVLVEPGKDIVEVDGKKLKAEASTSKEYYLLNKPRQVITSLGDPEGRKTIKELLPNRLRHKRLLPIGRLDYDVNGCLLLTNDGDIIHRLLHPKTGIERIYSVKVKGMPDERAIKRLQRLAKKSRLKFVRKKEGFSWWQFSLFEGKYHQVKLLWRNVGHPVDKLRRVSFAGIGLGPLKTGAIRKLTKREIDKLRKVAKVSAA